MSTGILINARLGSQRLKQKHLLKVKDIPLISYLIKRIEQEFSGEIIKGEIKLIISTGDVEENKEFENLSHESLTVFYGSKDNIPLRHLQTAEKYNLKKIISVDGDDLVCAIMGMREVYKALNNNYEYIKTSNLPFGMNCFGYSVDFLKSSLVNYHSVKLETGWGRIFNENNLFDLVIPFPYVESFLRFTLDYQEDYLFFKKLFETLDQSLSKSSDLEIVKCVIDNQIYMLNEAINDKYWNNFNTLIAKENRNLDS